MNDVILSLKQVLPPIRKKYAQQQNASKGILANLDALMRKLKIATRPGGPKDIGFFGAMSRGKSSLINALLGCDLMPVKALQTTSVVIKVKHSNRPHYKVTIVEQCGKLDTHDNLTLNDAQATLQVFGTRSGNGGDSVDYIEVEGAFPDSKILKIGGVLVDTPGAEAAFEHTDDDRNADEQNRAVRILEGTDVILFVEGADYLSSANSCTFFKNELSVFKPLIVVNKKDKFTPDIPATQQNSDEMIELAKLSQIKNEVLKVYHTNISACVSCTEAKKAREQGDSSLYERSRIPMLENLICQTFENLKPENIALHAMNELDAIIAQVGDTPAKKDFFLPACQQFFTIPKITTNDQVKKKAKEMYDRYK